MFTRYTLKPGFQIYFLEVWYEDTVYAFGSGLGFTNVVYGYAIAETEAEAVSLANEKFDVGTPKVRKIRASIAVNQNLNRYCYPENMAGLNKGSVIS